MKPLTASAYSPVDYQDCLQQALDLAAEMALKAIATDHDYFQKDTRDFALDKDHAIEQQLCALLKKLTPDIPVVGEETFTNKTVLPPNFWVIDPIDGTVNFSRQMPLFGITVTLMSNFQAIATGIAFPQLAERYIALQGQGATLNSQPIQVSNTDHLADTIIGLGDFSTGTQANHKHQLTHALLGHYAGKCLRIRMLGSAALQLAWLAAGRLDLSITLSNKPWDVQGGSLLVREAGGQVFDQDGTPHGLDSRFTLASNIHLKEELLYFLQDYGDRPEAV